jgi:hypothetical protein
MDDSHSLQVLHYAWSLTYAARHDSHWQSYLNQIKSFVEPKKKRETRVNLLRNNINRSNNNNHRIDLPMEAIAEIMSFMDAISLCCSSSVCKSWYILASNERLWERLLQVQFSLSITSFKQKHHGRSTEISAKEIFIMSQATMNGLLRPQRRESFRMPTINPIIISVY